MKVKVGWFMRVVLVEWILALGHLWGRYWMISIDGKENYEGNVPSDNLDLVTIGCSFVFPIHQDWCRAEGSGEMHWCVLSTDTLLVSSLLWKKENTKRGIPCVDHFPKRDNSEAWILPMALIHPHSSTIALAWVGRDQGRLLHRVASSTWLGWPLIPWVQCNLWRLGKAW